MMCTQQTFRKNPQDIIIRVMPTIIQGLMGQQNPEFQIGSYMIITVLAANLPLDDKLLDSLMSGVVEGWSEVSISPGLACVAFLAQERIKSTTPLPIQVVNGLCRIRSLGQMLVEMGREYRVDGLVNGLVIGILSERQLNLERIELIEKIISEVNIPHTRRKDLFMMFLQAATMAELNEVLTAKIAEFLTRIAEGPHTQQASKILHSLMHSGGFDIENLELKLQTVIRPAVFDIQVPTTDSPTAILVPPTDPKTEFEKLISCLPDISIETSFLSSSPSKLFPHLYKVLLQATVFPSDTELERLFHLPLFTQRHINEAFTLTFLVRIWTSKTYPVLVRLAALAQANKIISYPESNTRVDYQALLPYILIALADPSKKIRVEAVNMVVSLSSRLKHIELIRKKDKSITVEIWGFDSIFGKNTKETKEVKWMETSEARKFLYSVGILDALEEAVVDKNVVYRVIAHSLGREGSSLKKNLKVTVMSFLASHVLGSSDLSIKLQLLKLINAVAPGVAAKAKPAVAIVESWVQVDDYVATWVKRCSQDKVEIEEIEKEILRTIGEADKGEGVELLISIIKGSYGIQPNQIGGMRKWACSRLREIWPSLQDDVKVITAQKLLEVATANKVECIAVSGEAMDVLRNVAISVEVFEHWLQDSLHGLKGWTAKLGSGPSDGAPSAKRTKRNDSDSDRVANIIHNLTAVLELMETRSFGEKGVELLKLGFSVLSEVINVAGDIGITVAYLLQLTLSILGDIVNSVKVSLSLKCGHFYTKCL